VELFKTVQVWSDADPGMFLRGDYTVKAGVGILQKAVKCWRHLSPPQRLQVQLRNHHMHNVVNAQCSDCTIMIPSVN